jgi:hypothetical protein
MVNGKVPGPGFSSDKFNLGKITQARIMTATDLLLSRIMGFKIANYLILAWTYLSSSVTPFLASVNGNERRQYKTYSY